MLDLPRVRSRTELDNAFLGKLAQVCFVTRDHKKTLRELVRLVIGPRIPFHELVPERVEVPRRNSDIS